MTSAAEFVEGGVQDPCDDACSICLESFCEDDPVTVSKSTSRSFELLCLCYERLEVVTFSAYFWPVVFVWLEAGARFDLVALVSLSPTLRST